MSPWFIVCKQFLKNQNFTTILQPFLQPFFRLHFSSTGQKFCWIFKILSASRYLDAN